MKKAGFRLIWTELTLEGEFVVLTPPKGEKRQAVRVRGTGKRVVLRKGSTKPQQAAFQRVVGFGAKQGVSGRVSGRLTTEAGKSVVTVRAAVAFRKRARKGS